jgi:hypothetical protein
MLQKWFLGLVGVPIVIAQLIIAGSQLPLATPAPGDVVFGIKGGVLGVGGTTSKFLVSAFASGAGGVGPSGPAGPSGVPGATGAPGPVGPSGAAGGSSTPTPLPSCLPYAFWCTYSQAQTGNSPFLTPIATLIALGVASPVPSAVPSTIFDAAIESGTGGIAGADPSVNNGPVYVVSPNTSPQVNATAPALQFLCTLAGYGGGCAYDTSSTGIPVYLPAWATNEQNPFATTFANNGDGHLAVLDLAIGLEYDCYQGANNSTWEGTAYPGSLACGFGRSYPIGSNGLYASNANVCCAATHSGYAAGLFVASPTEIEAAITAGNTSLNHALGIAMYCLNNNSQWPALRASDPGGSNSDKTCTSDTSGNTYPEYGEVLVLKSSYSIPATFTAPCQVLLKTLQTYGGYFVDTGNPGLAIQFLSKAVWTMDPSNPPNPWPTMWAQLESGGNPDANGTYVGGNGGTPPSGMYFHQCMQSVGGTNLIAASNFTVYVLTQP